MEKGNLENPVKRTLGVEPTVTEIQPTYNLKTWMQVFSPLPQPLWPLDCAPHI